MQPARDISRLIDIMAALRDPETGCPWDRVQTFQSIAPYTIEEAYEVVDAIEREDLADLKDELGDLLLQVVYHARMAEEVGAFSFSDVVEAISSKMIRRHPHVFGEQKADTSVGHDVSWDRIKAEEKAAKAKKSGRPPRLLDDVPAGLPGLVRAVKLQKRAAKVGFDWPGPHPVLVKIREELAEVEAEIAAGEVSHDKAEGEIGDLLFAIANLARHVSVDPGAALRRANQKFIRRFAHIEDRLGVRLAEASIDEMEALWVEAKAKE